jgi:pyruvate dehydrogenase E2 component (dihydrolipoamide acetyltransferase)
MAEMVKMPRLSDTMDDGIVVSWLKAEGDLVAKGEPLCEIEMDKATVTYDSPLSGRVVRHLCIEGAEVAVGAPIAEIDVEGG